MLVIEQLVPDGDHGDRVVRRVHADGCEWEWVDDDLRRVTLVAVDGDTGSEREVATYTDVLAVYDEPTPTGPADVEMRAAVLRWLDAEATGG